MIRQSRATLKTALLTGTILVGLSAMNMAHAELLTSDAEPAAAASGNELTFVDDSPTNGSFDAGAEVISTSGATNITLTGDTDTVIDVDSDGALSIDDDLSSDLSAAGAGRQGVIDVSTGGVNTTITIQNGISVQATGANDSDSTHSVYIVRDAQQSALINDGTLSSTTGNAVHIINGVSADITNNASGQITGGTGAAAIVFEASNSQLPTGSLVNSGTITGDTAGVSFILNGDPQTESYTHTGDITNNSGATIEATNGSALHIGRGVLFNGNIVNNGTFTSAISSGAGPVSFIEGTVTGDYDFSNAENTSAASHIVSSGTIRGVTSLSATQDDVLILSSSGTRLADISGDASRTHNIVVRDLTAAEAGGASVSVGTVTIGNDDAGNNSSTINNIDLIDIQDGTMTIDFDVTTFDVDQIDIANGAFLDNDTVAGLDVQTVNLAGGILGSVTFSNASDTVINVTQGAQANNFLRAQAGADEINIDVGANNFFTLGGDLIGFETVNINTGSLNTSLARLSNAGTVNINQGTALDITGSNGYQADITNVDGTMRVASSARVNGLINLNTGGTIQGDLLMDGVAGAQTLNLNGGLLTGALDLNGDGDDVVNVQANYTTQATFNNIDLITVENGASLSIAQAHGTDQDLIDMTLNAGGRLNVRADVSSAGVFTNNGTLFVQNGDTFTVNSLAGTAEQTIFEVQSGGDAGSHGRLVIEAGAALLDGSNLQVNLLGSGLTDGDELLIVDGTGAPAVITNGAAIPDSSFIYSFRLVDGSASLDPNLTGTDNTDILLRVSSQSIETALDSAEGSNTNIVSLGRAIDNFDQSANAELVGLRDRVAEASSEDELRRIVDSATPTMDTGDVFTLIEVANQTIDNSLIRLASLRGNNYYGGGLAAGNRRMRNYGKVWGQVFGTMTEQKERNDIPGYEATSYGFTFGVDTGRSFDDGVFGATLSYADTDVDSDNLNNTERAIDTLQLNLYGEYYLHRRAFIDGLVGVGLNTIDQVRYNVGGTTDSATATYDSQQYVARIGAGLDMGSDGWSIRPKVFARYSGVDMESFTETGTLAQSFNADTYSALDLGLDLEVSYAHEYRYGSVLKPRLLAGVQYDVIGDPLEAKVSFVNGGPIFDTQGPEPAQTSYKAGIGFTYFTLSGFDFSADYVGSFQEDQHSHSAMAKLTYNF